MFCRRLGNFCPPFQPLSCFFEFHALMGVFISYLISLPFLHLSIHPFISGPWDFELHFQSSLHFPVYLFSPFLTVLRHGGVFFFLSFSHWFFFKLTIFLLTCKLKAEFPFHGVMVLFFNVSLFFLHFYRTTSPLHIRDEFVRRVQRGEGVSKGR